jgi:hypothetical protein
LVSSTLTVSLPSSFRLIGEGKGKSKVKVYPRIGYETPGGAKWGVCLTSHPGGFTPENDPTSVVQEAWWSAEPVWTGTESLAPTGVRPSGLSARSELLYKLPSPSPS